MTDDASEMCRDIFEYRLWRTASADGRHGFDNQTSCSTCNNKEPQDALCTLLERERDRLFFTRSSGVVRIETEISRRWYLTDIIQTLRNRAPISLEYYILTNLSIISYTYVSAISVCKIFSPTTKQERSLILVYQKSRLYFRAA